MVHAYKHREKGDTAVNIEQNFGPKSPFNGDLVPSVFLEEFSFVDFDHLD